MANERTFSFESQDDGAAHHVPAHHVQRDSQSGPFQQPPYQPYRQLQQQTPAQEIVSPPPRYVSPERRPDPVSPQTSPRRRAVNPATHLLGETSPTRDSPRRPPPSGYADYQQAPAPPPHRTSPTRLSRDETAYAPSHRPYADADPVRSIPHSYSPYDRDREGGRGRGPSPQRQGHSPSRLPQRNSYSSAAALAAGAATPGSITPSGSPGPRSSGFSGRSIPLDDYHSVHNYPVSYAGYHDSPYQGPFNPSTSSANIMNQASINPNNILDDGDDGFATDPASRPRQPRGNGAVGAAPAGGATGVWGAMLGRKNKTVTPSGTYKAVAGAGPGPEKSEWLNRQAHGKRKMRRWVGVGIGLLIVLAIVGGILGGVLGTRSSGGGGGSSSDSTNNADTDTATNGDLGKDSAEIQALMNNKNLHKVFPGMDYTPWGTQYPLCNTYPPSQNNVTRDMAVLSQLTNAVRLYGTDCNQTQMVLHAIDRLQLTDMKVWMGVWIDTNQTTTKRQLDQMYTILENTHDLSIFKGVIIGNEALYRAGEDKAQSEQELIDILNDARTQFKNKGYNLPIATSDLGDNWNAQLVTVVDFVMSNIHPFFAGVTAEVAAGWTWDFWQNHDVVLTNGMSNVKQVISETGWPSAGGQDCGGTTGSCAPGQSGAVADVDNMNTFMSNWVCQALANGTEYFWFEAFDEPWKVVYNTPDQQWEDKWGLMDPGRNLKPGLQIPDCGGKTVS